MMQTRVSAPAVFENLDRLVQVEMRLQGLPVGIIGQLYNIARAGGPAISYQAAVALQDSNLQRIACVTGIVAGPLPVGEVDGPLGAAALANGLCQLGRQADVVVPAPMVDVVDAVRRAMGASFRIVEEDHAKVTDYDAAITVEKLGRNRKGVVHSIFGAPVPDHTPIGDDFIEGLSEAGKLTIGIGDGGNEIGFGAIFDEARSVVPRGADCGCDCHDGLVTSTATKIVYPANVSNFGAYALTTAVGILAGRPLLLPSEDRIAAGVDAAVTSGCVDGGSFEPGRLADDGIPIEGVKAVVALFRVIAVQHFRVTPRHG